MRLGEIVTVDEQSPVHGIDFLGRHQQGKHRQHYQDPQSRDVAMTHMLSFGGAAVRSVQD